MSMTQAERTGRVEVEVIALKESFDSHKRETAAEFSNINKKLDDLLALRNKGAGVFWLVSTLIGAGILGGLAQLSNYLFGK